MVKPVAGTVAPVRLRWSPEHCPGAARRSWRHAPDEVGPPVRIPFAPAASLSQRCTSWAVSANPALWRRSAAGWGRENRRAGCEPGLLRPFSLTGIDAVPPPASSDAVAKTTRGRGGAAAWGTSVPSCGLACEQFVLLRPVQRQIEFGQPGRGKLDGLPALQDRSTSCGLKKARPTSRRM